MKTVGALLLVFLVFYSRHILDVRGFEDVEVIYSDDEDEDDDDKKKGGGGGSVVGVSKRDITHTEEAVTSWAQPVTAKGDPKQPSIFGDNKEFVVASDEKTMEKTTEANL